MSKKIKSKKKKSKVLSKAEYENELQRLHFELIKLQEWVKKTGKSDPSRPLAPH